MLSIIGLLQILFDFTFYSLYNIYYLFFFDIKWKLAIT